MRKIIIPIITILLIALDQLSKLWIVKHIELNQIK
ncbi:signal peptidase II, partial [Streptococcus agalactiae]